jgi:hypothetical protein
MYKISLLVILKERDRLKDLGLDVRISIELKYIV